MKNVTPQNSDRCCRDSSGCCTNSCCKKENDKAETNNKSVATPTNVRGGWSLDMGVMGRQGSDDSEEMIRSMLGYGITEDLQISVSIPYMPEEAPLSPGRQTSMMPGSFDLEVILGWRFHRNAKKIGQRIESTLYGGVLYPSPQDISGMMGNLKKAPGFLFGATTGLASRSNYLWVGAMYSRFTKSDGDQRPDVLFYSIVYGYRPQSWRIDYPHWDWRIFIESTGERTGEVQVAVEKVSETGGHQIFVGPSTLGIYKNIAVEGGIQLPVFRSVGLRHQKEKFRYSLNFSYFF